MARNITIPMIIALLSIIQAAMCTSSPNVAPDAKEFFAKSIGGNLTKITWAHAVNSRAKLAEALGNGKVMMLEADVLMGTVNDTTNNSTDKIPIMGHPPDIEGDLSLEEFLETVLADGKHGIKLDFKSLEAFNGSRPMLEKHRANMTFPVWLNADILAGPVDADTTDTKPVEAREFLLGAAASLPESTLSIGWTTRYGSKFNIIKGSYTEEQTKKMIAAIAESNTKQSITYPVRAGLAANSITVLSNLLKETSANAPTLTIWSSENDTVDAAALSALVKEIGVDKVYIDVPEDLWLKIDLSSAAQSAAATSFALVGSVIATLAIAKLV